MQHDLNVLLKLNLAEKGLKSAQDIVAGKNGHGPSFMREKGGPSQWLRGDGRGFGLSLVQKWGVLVRVRSSKPSLS